MSSTQDAAGHSSATDARVDTCEPSRHDAQPGAVRFVHAADLHLDAAFLGMSRDVSPEIARRLHQSTFTALGNLFALCERLRPDLLLLAGDIYNQEDHSLRAQLAVRDGCARLGELGVRVCIVHGNHDPLSSRLKMLQWPGNVIVFDERAAAQVLRRDGMPFVVVHGASHAGPRETRNLAAAFSRTDDPCLQIGLLHTTLGEADGSARYAPCTTADLVASRLDYWALGHIHERGVVCQSPLAQYPGSIQGLHVGEEGPHGCLLVTATPDGKSGSGGGFVFTSTFQPLGPVEWRVLDITAEEGATLDSLENAVRTALAEAVTAAVAARSRGSSLVMPCTALVVRVRINGRTQLDALLRRPATITDLLERLRDASDGEPLVWIKDIEVDTRPLADRDAFALREDLLGEILRMADRYRADPSLLAGLNEEALAGLYAHARARKALTPPDADELLALLLNAEALCLDLLEND